MKAFIVDVARCNGCYSCQIVCKDEHVGNDWTPIAKPQPDTGQFWIKINETVRGTVPKVKMTYLPTLCAHCDDAACIRVCPSDAIYQRKDGMVIVDPEKCTGCRKCMDVCAYGALYFNWDLNIAQKCTGCAHLLDKGWKAPRCVDICPTDALRFGEEKDLKEFIGKAEPLHGGPASKVRVYYVNLPKRFVAGAVYDPDADECLAGAKVTLTDSKTGKKVTVDTDNFGDFWFHKVEVGSYSLAIEKEGYAAEKMGPISTEKDINVGDIKLKKK